MEILKYGRVPAEQRYRGTCGGCGCEVRCKGSEAKPTADGTDELTVQCPTIGCGRRIYVTPEKPPRDPAKPLRTGHARANCIAGGPLVYSPRGLQPLRSLASSSGPPPEVTGAGCCDRHANNLACDCPR